MARASNAVASDSHRNNQSLEVECAKLKGKLLSKTYEANTLRQRNNQLVGVFLFAPSYLVNFCNVFIFFLLLKPVEIYFFYSLNLQIDFGMNPVMLLLLKSSNRREYISQIDLGMNPVMLLLLKSSSSREYIS